MVFADPVEVVRAVAPDGIRVCDDVPAQRPARFITVDYLPVGASHAGVRQAILARRRLALYVWGGSVEDARVTCERLRDALVSWRGGRGVRGFEVVGEPSRRDDIDSGHHRFLLTVDARVRAFR